MLSEEQRRAGLKPVDGINRSWGWWHMLTEPEKWQHPQIKSPLIVFWFEQLAHTWSFSKN